MNVLCSFEPTDIIQFTHISFFYNRFSILTNCSRNSIVRLRLQLLLADNIWSTQYKIPGKDRYSDLSTDWSLVSYYSQHRELWI